MALGHSSRVLWPKEPLVAVPTTGHGFNINGREWFVNRYVCTSIHRCYNGRGLAKGELGKSEPGAVARAVAWLADSAWWIVDS